MHNNRLKIFLITIYCSGIMGCNAGSSSSNSSYSIDGPYTDNINNTSTCQFSNSVTTCNIALSYQASPAASLGTSGISSPYSITANSCTASTTSANCVVTVTYTPQINASIQTLSLTVGSLTATVPLSNN